MGVPKTTLKPIQRPDAIPGERRRIFLNSLLAIAHADNDTVLKELKSQLSGLSTEEADSRSKQYGLNEIAREKRQSNLTRLLINFKNPLVILLLALGGDLFPDRRSAGNGGHFHHGAAGRGAAFLPGNARR